MATAKKETPQNSAEPFYQKYMTGDYLEGDNFKAYLKEISQMDSNELHTFYPVKVSAIKQPRYEDVEGTPIDVVGFKIFKPAIQDGRNTDKSGVTKIRLKDAIQFNGMLKEGKNFFTVIGGQWIENGGQANYYGTYYLLRTL